MRKTNENSVKPGSKRGVVLLFVAILADLIGLISGPGIDKLGLPYDPIAFIVVLLGTCVSLAIGVAIPLAHKADRKWFNGTNILNVTIALYNVAGLMLIVLAFVADCLYGPENYFNSARFTFGEVAASLLVIAYNLELALDRKHDLLTSAEIPNT